MTTEERIAQLEARLAAAEARIVQLEIRGSTIDQLPNPYKQPSVPTYPTPPWEVTCGP